MINTLSVPLRVSFYISNKHSEDHLPVKISKTPQQKTIYLLRHTTLVRMLKVIHEFNMKLSLIWKAGINFSPYEVPIFFYIFA